MRLDLLPHEARLMLPFGSQTDVMTATLLLVMSGDAIMSRRGPVVSVGQSDS
jgi:hypothetical protein